MKKYIPTDGPINIQLASGYLVNIRDIKPEDINIVDIATSLANTCIGGGHAKKFYSNAQHSILVSHYVQFNEAFDSANAVKEMKRGLLHDAAEAYLMDIRTPLKYMKEMQPFLELDAAISKAIAERFDLDHLESPAVKIADSYVRAQEMRDFMSRPMFELPETDIRLTQKPFSYNIKAMDSKQAKEEFLKRFRFLNINS